MRNLIVVLTWIALSTVAVDVSAGTARRVLVNRNQLLAVTPFVVPFGVPVATAAPYGFGPAFYGQQTYNPHQTSQTYGQTFYQQQSQAGDIRQIIREEIQKALGVQPATYSTQAQPLTADGLIQQKCIKCHQPGNEQAGVDLSMPIAEWDWTKRRRVNHAVLQLDEDKSKHMPKGGKTLSKEEYHALEAELFKPQGE